MYFRHYAPNFHLKSQEFENVKTSDCTSTSICTHVCTAQYEKWLSLCTRGVSSLCGVVVAAMYTYTWKWWPKKSTHPSSQFNFAFILCRCIVWMSCSLTTLWEQVSAMWIVMTHSLQTIHRLQKTLSHSLRASLTYILSSKLFPSTYSLNHMAGRWLQNMLLLWTR